jgi:hypothetical protein
VGGIIVDDEMQVEMRRRALVDGLEEAEELTMAVAGHTFADDGAVEHVDPGSLLRKPVSIRRFSNRVRALLVNPSACKLVTLRR